MERITFYIKWTAILAWIDLTSTCRLCKEMITRR